MKIVEPSVEIITEPNPLKRIELAGRCCYKSEDKITADSALPFVKRLIARKHMTPLEQARIVIPGVVFLDLYNNVINLYNNVRLPYGFLDRVWSKWIDRGVQSGYGVREYEYTNINVRDFLAIRGNFEDIAAERYPLADDYMTVRFTCAIAMTRQLRTNRIFSHCEMSTRYCRFEDIEVVKPVDFEEGTEEYEVWKQSCIKSEKSYKLLLELGKTPQQARLILPLSTKSEIVVSGLKKDWENLIEIRSASDADPQMQYLMKLLKEKMEKTNA